MAKVKLDEVMDIARRITEDIRDLELSQDQWGNEDFSDALNMVSTLFDFAAAQMLYNVYKDDRDETTQLAKQALDSATLEAKTALDTLRHFGFSYTIESIISD